VADLKITQLTEDTSLVAGDMLPVVTDIATTAVTKKASLTTLAQGVESVFNAPEGFLINGKIVPSVATSDLTVAIKGMDGNDPSATNPVYCRIGNTVRSITAALSVTKADATNWCNAGSAELATKEIDYFVYLGYNATDGVVVGFSRIPYATLYSDFSITTTNEKYAGISTITNAAAGDNYVNIGRFAATLSAGAGYTWTVPTFTSANLIQRPIYTTRWLAWAPVFTGFSASPANTSKYTISGRTITLQQLESGDGTSNATTFTITAPMANALGQLALLASHGAIDGGATKAAAPYTRIANASTTISVYIDGTASTGWTNSGGKRIVSMAGSYPIA